MSDRVESDQRDLVTRLVHEVMMGGDLDVLEQIGTPRFAAMARSWIAPFRDSFTDISMQIVALVADGRRVAGHFRCSGLHTGMWLGHPPTGRRFTDVDEIYLFRIRDGRIDQMQGVEDTATRLAHLGLS